RRADAHHAPGRAAAHLQPELELDHVHHAQRRRGGISRRSRGRDDQTAGHDQGHSSRSRPTAGADGRGDGGSAVRVAKGPGAPPRPRGSAVRTRIRAGADGTSAAPPLRPPRPVTRSRRVPYRILPLLFVVPFLVILAVWVLAKSVFGVSDAALPSVGDVIRASHQLIDWRSEAHTSELQSLTNIRCRL